MNSKFNDIIQFINSSNHKIILLLPIGPPGSGKTTLINTIKPFINNRIIITPNRDQIFHDYRTTLSIRKSKHLTHQTIAQIITKSYTKNTLIYIDTTNSNPGIRQIYMNLAKPNITKFICFHTSHLQNPNLYLLNRTKDRIHPTFPTQLDLQIKTINTIINSIQYPSDTNHSFRISI